MRAEPNFHFSYRLDESGSTTLSEDYRPSTRRVTKPRYYFHPNAGTDQSVIDAHFKDNPGPLPGQLLPMAIPLGKPRKDPALRLPLCIDEGKGIKELERRINTLLKMMTDLSKVKSFLHFSKQEVRGIHKLCLSFLM